MLGVDSETEKGNAAITGCGMIRRWLAEESRDNSYGVQIAKEALKVLVNEEKAGTLPCDQAPSNFTTDEIIRRCRPAKAGIVNAEVSHWYARWLAIWTYYAIPNAHDREQALNLVIGPPR